MYNIGPRQILDISIAVCRRTVIIVTYNFKVKCVTHALISVVVQCNSNSNLSISFPVNTVPSVILIDDNNRRGFVTLDTTIQGKNE